MRPKYLRPLQTHCSGLSLDMFSLSLSLLDICVALVPSVSLRTSTSMALFLGSVTGVKNEEIVFACPYWNLYLFGSKSGLNHHTNIGCKLEGWGCLTVLAHQSRLGVVICPEKGDVLFVQRANCRSNIR